MGRRPRNSRKNRYEIWEEGQEIAGKTVGKKEKMKQKEKGVDLPKKEMRTYKEKKERSKEGEKLK